MTRTNAGFRPGDRVFFVGVRALPGNAADAVFATSPAWATVVEADRFGGRVPVVYDHNVGPIFWVRPDLIVPRWEAPVPDPRNERDEIEHSVGETAHDEYERGRRDGWKAAAGAVENALREAMT